MPTKRNAALFVQLCCKTIVQREIVFQNLVAKATVDLRCHGQRPADKLDKQCSPTNQTTNHPTKPCLKATNHQAANQQTNKPTLGLAFTPLASLPTSWLTQHQLRSTRISFLIHLRLSASKLGNPRLHAQSLRGRCRLRLPNYLQLRVLVHLLPLRGRCRFCLPSRFSLPKLRPIACLFECFFDCKRHADK